MADEPLFTFYGAALTGKKPQHKVSVPAGRMLLLKQAALGPKPPANARATLSVQCDEYPQLVLCTLSTAMPQALIEVVCSNDATLTFEGTPGAALHVCGVIMDPPSKREKAGQRAPTGASAAARHPRAVRFRCARTDECHRCRRPEDGTPSQICGTKCAFVGPASGKEHATLHAAAAELT